MYALVADLESDFTQLQIDTLPLRPQDTVLDIGAGPGRLSVPIAPRVRSVTALDPFASMRDQCRIRAASAGVESIVYSDLDWFDARVGENLARHDVVLCSRTVALADLAKVSTFATRLAAVIMWADAPSIPPLLDRLFRGTGSPAMSQGRGPDRGNSYIQVLNTAYELGYEPSALVVPDGFRAWFPDLDTACDRLRPLRPLPDGAAAEGAFRRNLEDFLTPDGNGMRFEMHTRSVVCWWSTDGSDAAPWAEVSR
ncbi:MAG: class I SAM-dependent methyltransferase [Propioniciclava sp.]